MAKRLSKSEYAGELGLRPEAAESLYQQLRAWKKAKTKEDAKRVLGGISAALGGRGYDPGGMTSEQVEAEKREQIKAISNVEEARRKSAEDYKIALVRAYATKYAQDAGASREAAERAGKLLEIRYKALFPQTFNVGGGSSGVGPSGLKPAFPSSAELRRLKRDADGLAVDVSIEDDETISIGRQGGGGNSFFTSLIRELAASQTASGGRPGEAPAMLQEVAQSLFPGEEPDVAHRLMRQAMVTRLTGRKLSDPEVQATLNPDGSIGWDKLGQISPSREEFDTIRAIYEPQGNTYSGPKGAGGGGGGLVTVEGITDEQYKALEDTALESLGRVGVGGGGDFSAGLRKIIGAAPAELPGLEAQIGGTSGLPMSQGEAGPGRTPAGEGTLPPGTSGEASAAVSPGGEAARGIKEQNKRISQGPDASLDEMWQAFQRLDEQRTTAKDRHMLENLQKSAEWIKAKNALGIEDDRKALRGMMMLTRQRKRDARIRDVGQLRKIRKDTNRRALMSQLSPDMGRETMPPTIDKGSSGAAVMGGAGGFDAPDKKEREV